MLGMKIIKVKVIFQIIFLIKKMTEVNRNHQIQEIIRKDSQSQKVNNQNKKEIHIK